MLERGRGVDFCGSVGLWVGLLDEKHPESSVQFVRREMRGRTQGRKIAQSWRRERHAVAALCRVPHPFFLPRPPGSLAVVSSVFFNSVA